jgi:hypothetical protein
MFAPCRWRSLPTGRWCSTGTPSTWKARRPDLPGVLRLLRIVHLRPGKPVCTSSRSANGSDSSVGLAKARSKAEGQVCLVRAEPPSTPFRPEFGAPVVEQVPHCRNVDRVQLIKGWRSKDDALHEQVLQRGVVGRPAGPGT